MQQQKRQQPRRQEEEAQDLPAGPTEEEQAEQAAKDAELDSFLDEVDDLLVENAEEFVAGFKQKGGQ